ncbi:2OG-Fe(II) oxygenase [Sphingomonas guangdongensis]|uniref:2OG-Fe(II) oxygenase n=1 Tax=Sphingomonas guangdongensis TaxID=1141890 RepID=UPI003183E8CB
MFYSFNSRPFIKLIENITGIRGLIPDPYFSGAGFHEVKNGGHLSIHADFNHHKMMNVERRINVLIYLNKDWKPEYGGQIELWDTAMTRRAQSHDPIFNRCLIFNTTSDSMHGNPQVVNHPDGVSRKSIALYYYTATWDDLKRSHTTQFKVRPGTEDRTDWKIKLRELKSDLLPPFVIRNLGKAKRQLTGAKQLPNPVDAE